MSYTRADLESIGEAFAANALLSWSRRILQAGYEDLGRLAPRGIREDHLLKIEAARFDVDRLRTLRKEERVPEPVLARERRAAMEEALDWRTELRGLAQAVYDSRPDALERFRPGVKVSRSLPMVVADVRRLLQAAKESDGSLEAVGVTGEFRARGLEVLQRLEESERRLDEERSLTPQAVLDLNLAKGTLYVGARFLCRVARVEFRREPARAALYGYGPLRRRAALMKVR